MRCNVATPSLLDPPPSDESLRCIRKPALMAARRNFRSSGVWVTGRILGGTADEVNPGLRSREAVGMKRKT
jgi:hypothetical protein